MKFVGQSVDSRGQKMPSIAATLVLGLSGNTGNAAERYVGSADMQRCGNHRQAGNKAFILCLENPLVRKIEERVAEEERTSRVHVNAEGRAEDLQEGFQVFRTSGPHNPCFTDHSA